MFFIVVSRVGWLLVGKELIGSMSSLVSSKVSCVLAASAGEFASIQDLDLAGLHEVGVEMLDELCRELGQDLDPCEKLGDPLEAVGEWPLVPFWASLCSAGGKKCESFFGCVVLCHLRGMAVGNVGV